MQKYSVLMAVYKKDNPEYFAIALDSMIQQTVPPDEIVIVKDGPITKELQAVINERKINFVHIQEVALLKNCGHGAARRAGVDRCKNELIAVMDSDDISAPNRCEKQLIFFSAHSEISVLGGQIEEFIDKQTNVVGKRIVPMADTEIKKYMKTRCPFNQTTVMLRKSDVVHAGNYQDWFCNEDYFLWIRLYLSGAKFANLAETLVHVRVGKDMYQRRGGFRYFQSELGIQRLMLDNGVIGYGRFVANVFARFVLQVLMPNWLRGVVFRRLARE